jgi:hypothetical protein
LYACLRSVGCGTSKQRVYAEAEPTVVSVQVRFTGSYTRKVTICQAV